MRKAVFAAMLTALLASDAAAAHPQFPEVIGCGPFRACDKDCGGDIVISITVQPNGSVRWNNTPVDRQTLASYLNRAVQDDPQPPFLLEPQGNVPYAVFARVLLLFQRAGIRNMHCIVPKD
jgi:hypothetical protein